MAAAGLDSRTKLLDAAMDIVRSKGYAATRIEDICRAANLTKGSFFYHFTSKEDLALAAAAHWRAMVADGFANAPYQAIADARERLYAYVAFRKAMLAGDPIQYMCFAGTMIQEVFATHENLLAACAVTIDDHVTMLEADIAEAVRVHGISLPCTTRSLAEHMQAVMQGALILAKAQSGPNVAIESLEHLRRYLHMLLTK